jgi:polysaccharide biosynthesis/export protein
MNQSPPPQSGGVYLVVTDGIRYMKLNVKLPTYIAIMFVALLVSACSSGSELGADAGIKSGGQFSQVGGPTKKGDGSVAASAAKIFDANSAAPIGGDDYKISALDVVEITVLNVPELTRTVQVSASGTISLPLVKTIKASGHTTTQLEKQIAAKLEATYLQSPQVSVYVKEFNSQKITVDGAVVKPGIFPKTGNVSLLQAIALAEGLSTVADPTGILIFRTVNNARMAARFDLKQVRSGKINDPMLQAGDIVMVDESSRKTTLRDITSAMPLTGLFTLLTVL